ncbi:hypothetical protein [Winogradskyella poriferorum]|uniref:hypothetical protein n=1 Tax=Winogradskyella poriferorum TaxID=307627 RepID=UPI003D64BAA4
MVRIFTVLILIAIQFSGCKESKIEEYKKDILGVWILENDSETKIEFLEDGTFNNYYGEELRSTENYVITGSCNGENQADGTFILKRYSSIDDYFCSYIEGLNFNGSNMLSLMTFNQGKIIVFIRE